jgi:hypothetical protein
MEKGEIALLQVQMRAIEKGAVVSKPTIEGGRYDLVIDWDGKLYRAQVKYCDRPASNAHGAVSVCMGNVTRGSNRSVGCYTQDEVDVVLVYVPKIRQVLWFGPDQFCGKSAITVRYEPTKNGQSKGCLMAQDFIW